MANQASEAPSTSTEQVNLTHVAAESSRDASEIAVRMDQVKIEVCYATPQAQSVIALFVASSCTIRQALSASGILMRHPEIDLSSQSVGVFGKIRQLDDGLAADDRIEIYRALTVDPMVARARRVAKTRKGGSSEGRKWAKKRIYTN